jgi:hypothetical protein
MPDALPIPDDLITLQRALDGARRELFAYSDRVAAERRELFPDPEQILERQTLPDEQATRLNELREAERAAGEAVRRHPVMVQAREEQCHHQTETALRKAATAG